MHRHILGLDIGSNSVGSAWIDMEKGAIDIGLSVFPAGVDETDEMRGEPKNAKRRMTRRTRITLARRSLRKRELRLELIARGLLPPDAIAFKKLLEDTDPWALRRKGLDHALTPHEFGRVLLHLAQRRGALGLKEPEEGEEGKTEDGKVKAALDATRKQMLAQKARSFGEFVSVLRDERRTQITTPDARKKNGGPREWRTAVRNKGGEFQFHADRAMIRDEFGKLWDKQKGLTGALAKILTNEKGLRTKLDDESGDSLWRHKGLLFGQRRQSWDMGTLGRCVLEPSERCAPIADMHASHYRVVETVNNIKIAESGKAARPLTAEERGKLIALLRGPLGMQPVKKRKGKKGDEEGTDNEAVDAAPKTRPKTTCSVTDIRLALGLCRSAGKASRVRLNIEADEDREINTDWFHRSIVHGGITEPKWAAMTERQRESVNRAILNFDTDREDHAAELRAGAIKWWGCAPAEADALVAGWKTRPPLEKRLNLSRRAVLNMLSIMDKPWPNPEGGTRWVTQIEARKLIAEDSDFKDATTGEPIHPRTRDRYATGAKGLTARDRHYIKRHPDSLPPAPMLTNPVVRKAIHEVRRHIVAHIKKHGRKPDAIVVELAREAKMSAKESDRTLFRNRLRNRIRNDIIETFNLTALKQTQQRAAVERVVLAVQQGQVCPLCGKAGLTPLVAKEGQDCELAHIVPRGIGGGNGLNNMIVAHTKCNRDMGRKTPRELWRERFEVEMNRVERMYAEVERIDRKQVDKASEDKLWACYFNQRDDEAKVANFKKELADIRGFSDRQMADTRYATRQVLAYLADALFDGKGLPERGGDRLIFTTDGGWTGDLRREWGLFQDTHNAKAKGLSNAEEHERKEKKRGDHRHHALDAVVVALTSRSVQVQWEQRLKAADAKGITAEQFDEFCRQNRIDPPAPFKNADDLRERVMAAVFGYGKSERPVSHRAVKRKIIGALHEDFPRGPVLDRRGALTDRFTRKIGILNLDSNHLRMPRPEKEDEAIDRLSERRLRDKGEDEKTARKWARGVVRSPGYKAGVIDPAPGKSGIVRDVALRACLRKCLEGGGLNPDDFTAGQLKKLVEAGGIRQVSGVPIRSVVLLWTMNDPVVMSRWATDHATGKRFMVYNAATGEGDAGAARANIGGNNHHIELRIDDTGKWSGEVVSTFEASKRKLAFFRALRASRVPRFTELKKLPKGESKRYSPLIAAAEKAHPLVDRSDDPNRGGGFVFSLCEGEMVHMLHKATKDPGYFVVAKLDKPNRVVLVPHWDARAAGERKDSAGSKVPDSKRDSFTATPDDFKTLAPPGMAHAVKVRVSPLGDVTILEKD
jgi:CRISPR-associated endonuclease Csn1